MSIQSTEDDSLGGVLIGPCLSILFNASKYRSLYGRPKLSISIPTLESLREDRETPGYVHWCMLEEACAPAPKQSSAPAVLKSQTLLSELAKIDENNTATARLIPSAPEESKLSPAQSANVSAVRVEGDLTPNFTAAEKGKGYAVEEGDILASSASGNPKVSTVQPEDLSVASGEDDLALNNAIAEKGKPVKANEKLDLFADAISISRTVGQGVYPVLHPCFHSAFMVIRESTGAYKSSDLQYYYEGLQKTWADAEQFIKMEQELVFASFVGESFNPSAACEEYGYNLPRKKLAKINIDTAQQKKDEINNLRATNDEVDAVREVLKFRNVKAFPNEKEWIVQVILGYRHEIESGGGFCDEFWNKIKEGKFPILKNGSSLKFSA